MADNLRTETLVTPDATLATSDVAWSGEASAHIQVVEVAIVAGSEGSKTAATLVGGAGAVAAGVPRVTLASDDPAVAKLGTIDADTGSILTAVELIDDAVHATNGALGKSVAIGGHLDDVATTAATEGNVAPARITAQRALHTHPVDATGAALAVATGTGLIAGDKGFLGQGSDGTNRVDIKVAADGAVAVDVESSALPAGGSTSAKQDTEIGHLDGVEGLLGTIDADTGALAGCVAGTELQCDVLTLPNVTLAAGTNTNEVVGDVAQDAGVAGNPVQIGCEAVAHGAAPSNVVSAAGDVVRPIASREGVLFVAGPHPNVTSLEFAYTTAQTDTAIITVGAGSKIAIANIQHIEALSVTVATDYRVGLGAANTPTTAGVVLTNPGSVPGLVHDRGGGGGWLHVGADGEDLRITSAVPTGGSARVAVSYAVVPS